MNKNSIYTPGNLYPSFLKLKVGQQVIIRDKEKGYLYKGIVDSLRLRLQTKL